MASFGIGAKLRLERVGRGLAIDDISRDTRIAPRFLEAIETDDYSTLPGLVFTRNFVRQYAQTLNLDPDPLLAELPKQDESTAPLPNPPARNRSSYHRDRRMRSIVSSAVWLLLAGAGVGAYILLNHSMRRAAPRTASSSPAKPALQTTSAERTSGAARETTALVLLPPRSNALPSGSLPSSALPLSTTAPVQVSVTAHDEAAWVQVSVDGKITFSGTLKANETRDISASEQVMVLTGNAGAVTISLNGKTLESLGPIGQVRSVRLTAEGPQFVSPTPPPAPDPL